MTIAATANFQDAYATSPRAMVLQARKITRHGTSISAYIWTPATPTGCVTTGFAGAFPSIERAIKAARAHRLFSNVAVV